MFDGRQRVPDFMRDIGCQAPERRELELPCLFLQATEIFEKIDLKADAQ